MSLAISGDSPNFTNATLTTPTLTSPTISSPTISGTPTGVGVLTSGTAVASTSGTSIDFTGIPSWAKRITVMFQGVSTSGTSPIQVQLMTGSSTPTTSGYNGTGNGYFDGAPSGALHTTGFRLSNTTVATYLINGNMMITNITGNTWSEIAITSSSSSSATSLSSGSVALAAALTAVRITTVNGTDAFDAGSINILYE